MVAGHVSASAFYASIPYGLGVMSILVGKHIDQLEFDARRGTGTLPVLVGERSARALNIATIVLMYALTALLAALGELTWFAAGLALALPRAWRALSRLARARPEQPPPGYVGWPLWYHRACLEHNRLFGWLYIAALAAGAAWSELPF
jgi:1,4-dihydroxy-2-naphthoate octaprenyltransferase